MKKAATRYSTVCRSIMSGEALLKSDVRASSLAEAETRGFMNCVRAGNYYDDIAIEAMKTGTGPTIH